MSNWQTSAPVTWFTKLYWAIWNSIIALWDDQNVTWDAIGGTDWKTPNAPNWKTKNRQTWETPNNSTWQTKN